MQHREEMQHKWP